AFALPLNEVGISGKTAWVLLPQGRLPFEAALAVDLSAGRRGIHMSRLEEVMTSLHDQPFADLRGYGLALGREMLARQGAGRGTVSLSGRIPLIRDSLISRRPSLDTVTVSACVELRRQGEGIDAFTMIGIEACHITACPCTQVYNEQVFGPSGSDCPFPTHSQRSSTRLEVEATDTAPTYEELLACLEEALHVTQDLLKRPDEAEIVLKSHRFPQFAEDAVRETARAVGRRLGPLLAPPSRVRITSLSLESIHIHDVHCRLECALGDILAVAP
ncbi:MAG: GTP cyclohydrolase I FolE2, partial [Desulfobulbaceae bacterium]|nr:GTP cyclohydrolase I FolE2 [Desulfobulbaceae bacterium]